MRAEDLHHKELLELDPDGGIIRFAGQRVLLLDAVAMGLLRRYLAENFGLAAARTVLTQFGFAHGWRMAESQGEFKWDTSDEAARAGTRIHALQGLFRVELDGEGPLSKAGTTVIDSYEAEQHLLHFGRADASICWTICGLMSGYLSRSVGEEIYVLEDRCMGKGDAACRFFGRTRSDWGEDRAEELRFFESGHLTECLDVSLRRVTETLKLAERRLRRHRTASVSVSALAEEPLGLVVRSTAMRHVVDLALRVAKVDATVLITGESGAGKEKIARLLHVESARAAGPFIAVNCAAITETLLESELFGHARGAFTGASHDRAGLFEAANGGTLLLDEIGAISANMQAKLLRVLQEREVRRVGENKSRKIDVRVLAATNRELGNAPKDTFRQDLYYRLKVVELHVPRLTERREDILPLARLLLTDCAARLNSGLNALSPSVADQLLRYDWPGNVRELENAMERAVALARGSRVELEDLPEEVRQAPSKAGVTSGDVRALKDVEKDYILRALALNSGNQTRTATQLGIGSATLYRKLKSYGLIGKSTPALTAASVEP